MDPLLKETVIWLNNTLLDGKFVKGLRVYFSLNGSRSLTYCHKIAQNDGFKN